MSEKTRGKPAKPGSAKAGSVKTKKTKKTKSSRLNISDTFLGSLSRRALLFIAFIVFGCGLLGASTNQLLIRTGVRHEPGVRVEATIQKCAPISGCTVTYQKDNASHSARYIPSSNPLPGTHRTVLAFDAKPDTVYEPGGWPLALSLTVVVIGLALTAYGSIRLYRHWAAEARQAKS